MWIIEGNILLVDIQNTGWAFCEEEEGEIDCISYSFIWRERLWMHTTVSTRTCLCFWCLLYLFMTHLLSAIYFHHCTNRGAFKCIIHIPEAWAFGNWVERKKIRYNIRRIKPYGYISDTNVEDIIAENWCDDVTFDITSYILLFISIKACNRVYNEIFISTSS